ncbi:MAG: amino-acid N-acetyltransferase [Spirochaetales bacterium]|nr:amino-acid N-acetyltransferase [Spirochaetales bacterium]
MDMAALHDQADIIRTAFSYINRFKGHTFVIRVEGSLLTHPFAGLLLKDIALLQKMGIQIVLIPGARSRIDEVLASEKISCEKINNIRITPEDAMPYVEMASFDVSNRFMTLLAENNCDAIIGNFVKARRIGVLEGVDYQCSGMVEKINASRVTSLLESGIIPIFPNIGWSRTGKPYNISSNELAFTLARDLQATKLFFITDFGGISAKGYDIPEGVYVSSDTVISQLTAPQARQFLDRNREKPGAPAYELVTLAYRACQEGIDRVHIIDGRVEGMLIKEIFSNRGLGTMIYSDPHENLRTASHQDIPDMLRVMQPLVEEGFLLLRTGADVEKAIGDYILYEVDGTLHGCGALHVFSDKSGEIAALAVDKTYTNFGIGKKIVVYLIEQAVKKGLKRVFLLTTQTADWFLQFGFAEVTVADLPPEKQKTYNTKRNSLILCYDLEIHRKKAGFGAE